MAKRCQLETSFMKEFINGGSLTLLILRANFAHIMNQIRINNFRMYCMYI